MPIAHAAGVGPDLKNIVVLNVGEILLPGRRHIEEVLLVRLPTVTARGPVGTLVVLALMPDHAAYAVGQPGLPDPPQHPTVDRG